MRFNTVVADSALLFAALEARKIDFVIARIAHRVPDQHNSKVLFYDTVKVTGSKSPLVRRRSIALIDLMDDP